MTEHVANERDKQNRSSPAIAMAAGMGTGQRGILPVMADIQSVLFQAGFGA